jgi:hypothetical protein
VGRVSVILSPRQWEIPIGEGVLSKAALLGLGSSKI